MRDSRFRTDFHGAGADSAPWIIAAITAMAIVGGMAYRMMSQSGVTSSYQVSSQATIRHACHRRRQRRNSRRRMARPPKGYGSASPHDAGGNSV